MRVSKGVEVTDLCGKTRTYRRPSPRTYCCAAIRPASIVCAFSQPPWVACNPNSPKTTRLPRDASPFIRPLWLFRCLTRFGISAISVLSHIHALIDPYLHADVALGGSRFGESIIDFRAQGAKRNRAGNRILAPSDVYSA